MKQLSLLLITFILFAIIAQAGYIRPQPEEYTKLFDVEMKVNFPVGEIKNGKLVYVRKDIEIKGVLELITSYLQGGGKASDVVRTPENSSIRATFYWMTNRTFIEKEETAKKYNAFNRAHEGSSTVGKQESVMSYPNSYLVTPTFSALGETDTKGGLTFKFNIPRGTFLNRPETTDNLYLPFGEFGYGHDAVTVTVSGELTASGGKVQSAEGLVVLTVEYEEPRDAWPSYKRFEGCPYIQRTGNRFHPNGWGTFKMKAMPYSVTWPTDLEQYFYKKYDYSNIEVLDRVIREAAKHAED